MRLSGMISAVDAHACGEPERVIMGGNFLRLYQQILE